MEISLLKKTRKPIFEKKENAVQPSMYQSNSNFFKESAHLRSVKPVDYHSRIIYGLRNTLPVNVHQVAKTNNPTAITVCPPNRPQSTQGRPMHQVFHQ